MTGTMYRLLKERRKAGEKLGSAAGKQKLWSKLGMGLGGLLAIGLTGGAATPLVAAMMAGGGTLAGGLLGRQGARKGWFGTDKAKLKGGRFYKDEASDLKSQIGEEIWAKSARAGLTAGMTALGSGLTFGKEGLKAAIPGKSLTVGKGGATVAGGGFKMGDIVKRGTETATYGDSLFGKLGKAIDIKGSVIGSKVGKMVHPGGWTGMELEKMGEASIGTATRTPDSILFGEGEYGASADFPQSRRHAQFAPGEMTAKMKAAGPSMVMKGEDVSARILQEGEALRLKEIGNLKQQEMNLAMAELNAQKKAGTGYGAFDRWIRGYGDTSQSQGLFDAYQEGLARTNAVSVGQHQTGSRYYMPGNISPEYEGLSAASLLMRRNR